jgi:hypothetical protein
MGSNFRNGYQGVSMAGPLCGRPLRVNDLLVAA